MLLASVEVHFSGKLREMDSLKSQINSQTESIGNATPNQLCADSIIICFESAEVRLAIHKPAHLAPGSLQCKSEFIRAIQFWV